MRTARDHIPSRHSSGLRPNTKQPWAKSISGTRQTHKPDLSCLFSVLSAITSCCTLTDNGSVSRGQSQLTPVTDLLPQKCKLSKVKVLLTQSVPGVPGSRETTLFCFSLDPMCTIPFSCRTRTKPGMLQDFRDSPEPVIAWT